MRRTDPKQVPLVARSHSLYARVAEVLRNRIHNKEWHPGDRLPSEADLCREFGVSSITVRRAMSDLASEGLLVRWQGKGTFVSADPTIVQGPPVLTSFTDDLLARGWEPSARVLYVHTEPAGEEVGPKLGIPAAASVITLSRVRNADLMPIAIQTAHLPAVLFAGLDQFDFRHRSLYDVMEHEFGIRPVRSTDTYRAGKLTTTEARLLEVPAGSAALRSERLSTDSSGRTIELVHGVIRADRYTLVLKLTTSRGAAD